MHPHRLFARWAPLAGADNPPVFHGRLEQEPQGFTITGTIRETRAVALLPVGFLAVCVCGLFLITLGLIGGYDGPILYAIGIPLAILFAVLFIRSLRTRRPRFRQQAGQLEHGLDTYVRTGDVSRAVG